MKLLSFFILGLSLFNFSFCFAETATARVELIPEVGATFFTVTGGDAVIPKSQKKLGGGLLVNVGLSHSMELQTGLMYMQEGTLPKDMGDSALSDDPRTAIAAYYLLTPIFAKYPIWRFTEHSSFSIKGGIAPALLANSQSNTSVYQTTISDVNSFDFQVLAGAEGDFSLSKGIGLELNLLFDRGLLPLSHQTSIFNQGWYIGSGLIIEIP
jgi:hypothetical protein